MFTVSQASRPALQVGFLRRPSVDRASRSFQPQTYAKPLCDFLSPNPRARSLPEAGAGEGVQAFQPLSLHLTGRKRL